MLSKAELSRIKFLLSAVQHNRKSKNCLNQHFTVNLYCLYWIYLFILFISIVFGLVSIDLTCSLLSLGD